MPGRRRRPRKYDECCYTNFGEQPAPLEIQIGYGLIPLVDQQIKGPLLDEITSVRNQLDGEYGLPLPKVHIRDNMCLDAYEYKILLHGVEVGGYKECNPHYVICMDTGNVTEELEGEMIKDPVFNLDAVIVSQTRKDEAKTFGYVTPEWYVLIKSHLYEISLKNITKFLDQCMVNTLVNKVRDRNPDVVDDVFFLHNFSTSKLKTILNWLLEEGVSIRDMNTILETIADNLEETNRLSDLMEKIREKLAYQFLPKLADENKKIHVIRVSQTLAKALSERIYYPGSNNELPYYVFTPVANKGFNNKVAEKAHCLFQKGYSPVFVIVKDLRTALSNIIRQGLGNWSCISDTELCSVIKDKDYSIVVEEELDVDEIKVNEPCPGSN